MSVTHQQEKRTFERICYSFYQTQYLLIIKFSQTWSPNLIKWPYYGKTNAIALKLATYSMRFFWARVYVCELEVPP